MRIALTCMLLTACNHSALHLGSGDLGTISGGDLATMSHGDLATPADLGLLPASDLASSCVAASVTLSGATPRGAFDGRWAWAYYTGGDCASRAFLRLFGSDDPNGVPRIDVAFASPLALGDQPVTFTLYTGDAATPDTMDGTAHLTVAEPLFSTAEIRLQGTLSVSGNGWNLSGSFSAHHCPFIDFICV